MDIQQAISQINNEKFASVYLVQGKEQYLAERFKQELETKLLKTEDDQLNFASFDMEETPVSVAIGECETIPFFGDKRLVYIEHPGFLTGEKKSGAIDHPLEELIHYVEDPLDSTILVIFAPYEKLDERKKVVKKVKKASVIVDVHPMKEQEIKQYVEKYMENEGYEMSREAFGLFMHLTDMELSRMIGELNKLMIFASDTKKISKQAVEELIPKALEHNIFDISNFILAGKTAESLRLYQELMLQGEEAIKINSILTNQFRLLLQVKILLGIGYQQSNMVETLKIHPYRVKLAIQQAKNFTVEKLGSVFNELVENDYKMKTGKMDKELLFELMILKLGSNS